MHFILITFYAIPIDTGANIIQSFDVSSCLSVKEPQSQMNSANMKKDFNLITTNCIFMTVYDWTIKQDRNSSSAELDIKTKLMIFSLVRIPSKIISDLHLPNCSTSHTIACIIIFSFRN